MLGLPKATELNQQLPKKAIYAKFQLSTAEKERMDADISRIVIVNELTPRRSSIAAGETVKAIYVMQVLLKRTGFDAKNIGLLTKLIPQNMIFVLERDGMAKMAVYHTRLLQTEWYPKDELKLELRGLNFDTVWENLIRSLEGGDWDETMSLDENMARHERQAKREKRIARLEKLARAEKQPKKKFELAQKINTLKVEVQNGQAENADGEQSR